MKRLITCLMVLMLCLGLILSMAEDAVSSATINVTELPATGLNPNAAILVIYFSTDDTVRAIARIAADALGADLFEIVPQMPYTAEDLNYNNSSSRATREQRDETARPKIVFLPEHLQQYDTILLGYPIWWGQAPKILYTFLESVDVSGKTIIPFCTSASSSAGSSARNLQTLTDESTVWLEVKRIENRSTSEEIRAWAQSLNLSQGETNMKMCINDTPVTVDWEDNEAVAALRKLAADRLTIQMSMYGGFEQVGPIGQNLPDNDEETVTDPGDIMLYAGNRLVVFYGNNSWAYTRLGKITDRTPDEMRELLGNGDVTITLTVE